MGKWRSYKIWFLASLCASSTLFSTVSIWTAQGGDPNWANVDNWSDGIPNQAGDTAIFYSNLPQYTNGSIDLTTDVTLSKVIIPNKASILVESEDNNKITFVSNKKQTAISGGLFNFVGGAVLDVGENAIVKIASPIGSTSYIEDITSASLGNDNSNLIFLPQGKKNGGSNLSSYYCGVVTDLKGLFTVGKRTVVRLDATAGQTFDNEAVVQKGGTLIFDATGAAGTQTFNAPLTIQKGATVNANGTNATARFQSAGVSLSNYGTFIQCRATVDISGTFNNRGTFQAHTDTTTFSDGVINTGTLEILGGASATSGNFTNSGRVNIKAGGLTMSAGTTFTNNKKKTAQFYSSAAGSSSNTFIGIVNNGTMEFFGGSTNNFNGAVTNNGVMRFYGQNGFASSTNTFAAGQTVTNNGSMYFYGLAGGAGNGHCDMDIGAHLTCVGRGSAYFFEDASIYFSPASDLSNTGRGTIAFYGQGASTSSFDAGCAITNSSNGQILFYANSDNHSFGDVTNSGSGKISCYDYSDNTFEGGTVLNSGTGSINFYGRSTNDLKVRDAAGAIENTGPGSINFYGNSISTVSTTMNLSDGYVNCYGSAQLTFNGVSEIHDGGQPFENPELRIYGQAVVKMQNPNANVYDYAAPTKIYQDGELILSGDLTNSTVIIGNSKKSLRGGTLSTLGTAARVSILDILNGGVVKPVANQVFTVGTYSQSSGATLDLDLDNHDGLGFVTKVDVTGTATLGGTLHLNFEQTATTADYTVLTANDTQGTQFDNYTYSLPDGGGVSLDYNTANTVIVKRTATTPLIALPTSLSKLKGDDQSVAMHLVKAASNMKPKSDAKKMSQKITQQSQKRFKASLKELTPQLSAAASKRNIKKTRHLAQEFQSALDVQRSFHQTFLKSDLKGPLGVFQTAPKTDFFIRSIDHQLGSKEYGAAFGWSHLYNSGWLIQRGASISESKLISQHGNISSKSAEFSPTLTKFGKNHYVSLTVITGLSQHHQEREISISDVQRKAISYYQSMDLFAELGVGYNLELRRQFTLAADFSMAIDSQQNLGYREFGAQSLNLTVLSHLVNVGESKFNFSLSKTMFAKGLSLESLFYLDGLCRFGLQSDKIRARLAYADDVFTLNHPKLHHHQMNIGATVSLKNAKNFESELNFKNNILEPNNRSTELKFNFLF